MLALVAGCAPAREDPAQESTPGTSAPTSTPTSAPSSEISATPKQSQSAGPDSKQRASKQAETGKAAKPKTLPASNVLVVVNKHTPLSPLEYAPHDLVDVGNGQLLRSVAAGAYQRLLAAASSAGHSLTASSGYRSYTTQVQTHNHWRNQHGAAYAERISAKPGYSEHQTGLAIDVMPASGQCRLEVCFGDLPEGQWVAENAHTYGFIIRYPQGQEAVTGYSYEPWHLRYVGVEAATSIKSAGQTMEAFYGYPAAPNYL